MISRGAGIKKGGEEVNAPLFSTRRLRFSRRQEEEERGREKVNKQKGEKDKDEDEDIRLFRSGLLIVHQLSSSKLFMTVYIAPEVSKLTQAFESRRKHLSRSAVGKKSSPFRPAKPLKSLCCKSRKSRHPSEFFIGKCQIKQTQSIPPS